MSALNNAIFNGQEELDSSFDGAVNLTSPGISADSGTNSSAIAEGVSAAGDADGAYSSNSGDSNATIKRKNSSTRVSGGRVRGSISVSVDEIDGNLLFLLYACMYGMYVCIWLIFPYI